MVPILKVDDVLITSIQLDLTDEAALRFQSDLLQKISDNHSEGVVIDITALEVVDSYMARILNETANMARLLGAKVVLSGMQPAVALTLVEMGRELIGVESAMSLEQSFEKLPRINVDRRDGFSGDVEIGDDNEHA